MVERILAGQDITLLGRQSFYAVDQDLSGSHRTRSINKEKRRGFNDEK